MATTPGNRWSRPVSGLAVAHPAITLAFIRAEEAANPLRYPASSKEKRTFEQRLGRAAAYRALAAAGCEAPPLVGRGPHGMPVWPEGMCGSITHTSGAAAAAVAPTSEVRSIGIDLELIRPLRTDIVRRIGNAHEMRWVQEAPGEEAERAIALFSAKESLYKALFPLVGSPSVGRALGFRDAVLSWMPDARQFRAELTRDLSPALPRGFRLAVDAARLADAVFTSVVVPHDPSGSRRTVGI